MKIILNYLKHGLVFGIGAIIAITMGVFALNYNYVELNDVSPGQALTASGYNQLLENVRSLNDRTARKSSDIQNYGTFQIPNSSGSFIYSEEKVLSKGTYLVYFYRKDDITATYYHIQIIGEETTGSGNIWSQQISLLINEIPYYFSAPPFILKVKNETSVRIKISNFTGIITRKLAASTPSEFSYVQIAD